MPDLSAMSDRDRIEVAIAEIERLAARRLPLCVKVRWVEDAAPGLSGAQRAAAWGEASRRASEKMARLGTLMLELAVFTAVH
jgi:hypothetical protein